VDILGGNALMSIFLTINVFVLGIVVALAYSHWRAHRSPQMSTPRKRSEMPVLPHDIRQRIIDEAESDYEKVIRKSAIAFEKDLETTTTGLSSQLNKLSNDIMASELERYRASLASLSTEATNQLGSASSEIETHQKELRQALAQRQAELDQRIAGIETELEQQLAQHKEVAVARQAELETKLEQEMAARRDTYAKQLDTKLGDSIATFLSETLGQQVDLGAQTAYLTSLLEEHKAELIQGIKDVA
jgi:vancomycin resistance protein YoaR